MASEAIADSLFSWLDPAGNTNTLDVDVVMSTEDDRQAKLTEHVVETGSVVTDHIVLRPEQLTFELLMTQTPLGGAGMAYAPLDIEVSSGVLVPSRQAISVRKSQFQPGGFLLLSTGLRAAVSGLFGAADVPTTMQGSESVQRTSTSQARTLQSTGGAVDRVNAAHDTLVEIMNTGLLVTVSFKGRLYVDYLLTSVGLSQGPGEAGCGKFKVKASAFRVATGVNVQLPDPADFRALPAQKKGNKPVKTPDPDPKKRGRGIVDRMFGSKASDERDRKALGLP